MTERLLRVLELSLNVSLPSAFRNFLIENRDGKTVMGNRILGLPVSSDPDKSVLGLTLLLRSKCPDLPQSYVAIALKDESFLCFDATQEEEDPSLLDVVAEKGVC